MAVHLTRIYTRTGDDGTTALGDFSRVSKTDPRLAAYADTDECNAALGVAVTVGGLAPELLGPLRQVQNDLFDVGADLCSPIVEDPQYPPLRPAVHPRTRRQPRRRRPVAAGRRDVRVAGSAAPRPPGPVEPLPGDGIPGQGEGVAEQNVASGS